MTTCPKCRYTRAEVEIAPDWQCPQCGISYKSYRSAVPGTAPLIESMPPQARDLTLVVRQDRVAVLWLLMVNLIVLVIALVQSWSNHSLMLIYWSQSVVIGIGNAVRIWGLNQFSTDNFEINGRQPEATSATKRSTALFFLFHYGFFHLVYVIFIFAGNRGGSLIDLAFGLCLLAFVLEYLPEFRQQQRIDQQTVPNIGALMFTPYLRIVPMHLTIIFSFGSSDSTGGLLLFGLLKTAADVAMLMITQMRRRALLRVSAVS